MWITSECGISEKQGVEFRIVWQRDSSVDLSHFEALLVIWGISCASFVIVRQSMKESINKRGNEWRKKGAKPETNDERPGVSELRMLIKPDSWETH